MIKAVIFDLDGTLLDTLDDLRDSVNFALAAEKLPLRSREEIRRFVGNGIRNLISRSVPKDCEPELEERVFSAFKEYYMQNCAVKTKPYTGIKELLLKLKAQGIKLGVVSNKADAAVKELIDVYFPQVFDTVCGERADVRKKPEPDSVLESMKHLCVKREETVYVGDSDVDSLTAKNAGTHCILVSWGFRDKELLMQQGADAVTDSADALYEAVSAISERRKNEDKK